VGSKNAGTTNVLRTLGTKAGLIVFAGDALKCIIAVFIIRLIYSTTCADRMPLLMLYTGAGVILGHNFPFYLKFKGGKGIAATAGMIISFSPLFTAFGVLTFFSTFFITHYVSLGSLLVYLGFMIELVVLGEHGFFHMTRPLLMELYGVGLFLAVMAYARHWENIKRLLSHTERKTYLSKKKQEEQKAKMEAETAANVQTAEGEIK
ncbi:MAG: glycerol-3-phosphate acyltransferase, partial [Clostridia bacterium]|nr:glycerol-3-phosphate acyltransferase [Clostridia bacterium]